LVFELQGNDREILIRSPYHDGSSKRIQLSNFKDQSWYNDELRKYNYFIEMVNLMADLCYQRNYVAIQVLENLYPKGYCLKILQGKDFDLELRRAFCRIIITLWIDQLPYREIQLPQNIRVWIEIEEMAKQIAQTDEDIQHFNSIKLFVKQYLTEIAHIGYLKGYERAKNGFVYEILTLVLTMLKFGFFKTSEEVNEIIKNVGIILNGTFDVVSQEEEDQVL
jgi:hypothetical protein